MQDECSVVYPSGYTRSELTAANPFSLPSARKAYFTSNIQPNELCHNALIFPGFERLARCFCHLIFPVEEMRNFQVSTFVHQNSPLGLGLPVLPAVALMTDPKTTPRQGLGCFMQAELHNNLLPLAPAACSDPTP